MDRASRPNSAHLPLRRLTSLILRIILTMIIELSEAHVSIASANSGPIVYYFQIAEQKGEVSGGLKSDSYLKENSHTLFVNALDSDGVSVILRMAQSPILQSRRCLLGNLLQLALTFCEMSVSLIVSLDKYERLLLDSFQASFLHSIPELIPELRRHLNFVLTNFHWTYQVLGTIQELLYDEDWVSNHRGDPQLIWTLLSQRLRSEQLNSALSCSSKHNLLFQDNPQLIEQMTNLGEGDITWDLHPAQGQEPFWDIVVNLLLIDQLGIPGMYDSGAISSFLDLARSLIPEEELPSSVVRGEEASDSTPLDDRPGLDTVKKSLERKIYDKELRQNDESKKDILSADDDDDHNHDNDDDDNENDERSGDADSAVSNRNFEIWSLVKSCTTLCRSTKESFEAVRAGLEDCGFYEQNKKYGNQYIPRKDDEITNKVLKVRKYASIQTSYC